MPFSYVQITFNFWQFRFGFQFRNKNEEETDHGENVRVVACALVLMSDHLLLVKHFRYSQAKIGTEAVDDHRTTNVIRLQYTKRLCYTYHQWNWF